MSKYSELKGIRRLSERGDTNSIVDLVQDEQTGNLYVRKVIYGIDQPLYQGIFLREVQALHRLNSCDNIVKIINYSNMIATDAATQRKEKVGCIFLEYISGETLANKNITQLTSKQKFKIVKQLLSAIETAHHEGIIHRDINPNNIMLDENEDVKVIDFGICKIKQMVNSATVFRMGTNLYSAPEVHLHSQNATEQSDLYSIGAVMYYLFTGKQPPVATAFQDIIEKASGFDIELKPIIAKLVAESPGERYKDISELKADLAEILERFLDVRYTAVLTLDFEKFNKLKNLNLIPRNSTIRDINDIVPSNYMELYISQDDDKYQFLGTNYYLECIYNENTNIFMVAKVQKIVPLEREIMKRKFCEISAKLSLPDPRFIHKLPQNDNLEIKNIVDAYCEGYRSKDNVDAEYKKKYGAWRELLTLTKKSIEESVQRFSYDSYKIEGNICSFKLSDGVFFGDTIFNKETRFVFEKKKKDKNKLIYIGNYDEDILVDEHVILKIRFLRKPEGLPAKGFICLDYSENMINIDRQLDALDSIERENYTCSYSLKEIFAGVSSPKTDQLYGKIKFLNARLDSSQAAAVEKALYSESIAIIQGPPGTGKTNVVIEIIRQILKNNADYPDLPEKKILLVSQSHPAVDKMLDDLIQQNPVKPNLIRVGRDEKLNDEIREEFGLNYVKDNWVDQVRKNCKDMAESYCKELGVSYTEFESYYKEYEKKFVSNIEPQTIDEGLIESFGSKTNTPSKEKLRKILEIQKQWSERLSQCEEVDLYIIKNTTIIAGTCTGFISNRVLRNTTFDYVIVDEAAKATYPELAVSFSKAEKIILVGDHKQLPPVLDTDIIEENKETLHKDDFTEGLFEKLYDNFPKENKHRLSIQYRMHPVIGSLISKVFYENEIQNGTPKEKRNIGIDDYNDVAIEWITTSKLSTAKRYEKKVGNETNATYKNDAEISIIRDKLHELDSLTSRVIRVGVITAYRAQKSAIKDMIKQQNFKYLHVEVDTVDAFQGGQKEVIIYSTVRSSSKANRIGFLKSEARLNVSLSRAQSLLIIVGDLDFLNNPHIHGNKFPEIIQYINQTQGCRITEVGE
ncbi:MAG: protein kinase [Clostridia bacterium]|nr:protein kinase [Clostridia bacterium]